MNAPDPDWSLHRSFLAVMREGSLSGAARALDLTQPTLARHVAALEAALGVQLFVRSRQGLDPTDAARELLPFAENLEATAAAMLRTASSLGEAVKGTVRISASEVVGAEILPPILADLRERHPELEFELVLSNTIDNLLRRDADIAVRMVEPDQQALVVRRLGVVTLGLHAHRRYLQRAGEPRTLEEALGHSLIGFDRETPALRAMMARLPLLQSLRFTLRTDSDLAQLAAIRAGFGLGVCQTGLARRDPNLTRLLPEAIDLKLGVWLAMHENLKSTPRCRTVFDGLAEGLKSYLDPRP